MSNLLEVKKIASGPTLVTTADYNRLDFTEKLKFLIKTRTAIEKEINWVEKDLGKFVSKRKF
mgnify:FL=1|jgi:hypothetical protein|tara:strand:- start:400 stop:585 length:186 start_codon:yes stop_codon:yes gene_type:complete